MTDTSTRQDEASVDDLLTLVSRIADQARPGEELEVYASRGVETDVRAYDGEIEQLASAASAGVGIRVVAAQRQGFAYAGTLDEDAIGHPELPGADQEVTGPDDRGVKRAGSEWHAVRSAERRAASAGAGGVRVRDVEAGVL